MPGEVTVCEVSQNLEKDKIMSTKKSAVDWPTVLKLMGGGAALGGGIGAASTLVKYLKGMNDKAKAKQDTSRDDDVLYLDLPAPVSQRGIKRAAEDKGSSGTLALGSLGSMVGAYLAYNAVRGAYSKMKRKQLQGELDTAQHAYLGGLGRQVDFSKAASQFSGVNKVVGGGYLAGLLTILGSAVLANKLLQKQFPDRAPRNPHQPRKIVIRTMRNPDAEDQDVPAESLGGSPDATENLMRLNLANTKSAASWGLTDLMAAAAQGRCQEIKRACVDAGADAAFDICKGASNNDYSNLQLNLAISWAAHDPIVSQMIEPYLAAQLVHDSPTFAKAASVLMDDPTFDRGLLEDLVGLTEVVNREIREQSFEPVTSQLDMTKAAMFRGRGHGMLGNPIGDKLMAADALSSLLDRMSGPDNEARESRGNTNAPVSRDSEEVTRKPRRKVRPPTFRAEDDAAKGFLEQNRDVIDQALSNTMA